MIDIPELGAQVRIWPHPERRVTDGPAPFTTTGALAHHRFLPKEGVLVTWTKYHLEQLRQGDIFLHDPNPKQQEPTESQDPPETTAAAEPLPEPPMHAEAPALPSYDSPKEE